MNQGEYTGDKAAERVRAGREGTYGYGGVSRREVLAAAGLLSLGLAMDGSAGAAAEPVERDRIVVRSHGVRVVITRDPFRMVFIDARGRRVLSEVANTDQPPLVVPPVPDPLPLGVDGVAGPTLYAPLTFLLGAEHRAQYPGLVYGGNLLTGAAAGIEFSARAVIDARRHGARGVQLAVSTSDPDGRELVVTVDPVGEQSFRITARVTPDQGVSVIGDSFVSAHGESFRGFGGRHNALDQRGHSFFNWVQQQNTGAGPFDPAVGSLPGSGGDRYLFPNGPAAAFYVQSQFVSPQGYGFLLDRDTLSSWRMASDHEDAWKVAAVGAELDYVVSLGEPGRAIRNLTTLTGRHPVPPEWAAGPMLDRLTRFGTETAESYRDNVEADLRDIDRYGLPLKAYRIEAWAWLDRDYLRGVITRLHERGIAALLYFRAFVGTDEIGTDSPEDFTIAVDNGYVATTATGQPYIFVSNFFAPAAVIDFTNPAARDWWDSRIHAALDLGADGFMQDFGEQVLEDMHFANGETGTSMHNQFPVLFHRVSRRAIETYRQRHPRRKVFFFTRAGYSGTPGAARYENANFPGDETTDWSRSSGLASLTTDMLNRGVCGAFGYGTDIGGYFDFHTPPTTKELFIRWAQWAALSPVMRLHGSINAGTHTPWSYDEETVEIYRHLSELHLKAAPLIMRLWREGQRTGLPIARPLWLAYPGDPDAAKQDQQWMLGPDVLVAPVVEQGATSRTVYFPAGCWQQPDTGDRFDGPAHSEVEVPLTRLPYFFRCGISSFDDALVQYPAPR